jgi:3-oxoacyl-[acyl-carrier-protein] synthase II
MHNSHSERRVVITGMGVIAPNGQDLQTFWQTICEGKSSADYVTRFNTSRLPANVAAEIKRFVPGAYMDAKTARRLERSLQYSVAAASLAAKDSCIDFSKIDPDRTGVIEATSMSNMEATLKNKDLYVKRGYRSMTPSILINAYFGSGSGEIAEILGIKGHAISCSSSSASGNDAMGYALSMIRNEEVDVMLAGGAEAPLIEEIFGGFHLSRAMTRYTDDPTKAMRPFDATRNGFVLGEGGGFLVLEELTHALSRGAKIYAEVLAQARSCEAYHPLAPHPDGVGVHRAMEKALHLAHVQPTDVDYINAHGSATEAGDLAETRAIKRLFGQHATRLAVSSTKPVTGHPMAAAGALETIACTLALHHQIIPLTLNHVQPGTECDLDYVPGKSRPYPIRVALNINTGFGGKNSCLVLRTYPSI